MEIDELGKSERRFRRHPVAPWCRIADAELCDAVGRAEEGLIDADLGGGVIWLRLSPLTFKLFP